jgi:uncharacterized protein (DUF1501 family)
MSPRPPHAACACQDFNRSEMLRRGAAQAGYGLPTIEPGMPTPAGTGLSRRGFLLSSAGLALSVYGAGRLLDPSAFEEGIARAASVSGAEGRVLVSVYLQGGIDAMSVLYPAGEPLYEKYRPVLGLPAGAGPVFTEDPRLFWNPAAAPLAQLHTEGKVSVLPAVGYTHPDESHFTSRHFWEVGATDAGLLTGWMGRYLDLTGTPDNPLQGLSLDDSLQPSLATARVPVATLEKPPVYEFYARGVGSVPLELMYESFDMLGEVGVGSGDPGMAQSGQAAFSASMLRRQLLPLQPPPGAAAPALPAGYPQSSDTLPARMAGVAQLLAAGMPLRCVSVSTESVFDTHNDQAPRLSAGLGEAAQTVYAFQRDLEARGLADRVLTLVWSEFGRRPKENASGGTDHGAAGCGFVIGTQAAGRMIGEWPGLARGLDALGNVRATSDFRGLYSSLLEQWLGQEASPIIPGAARLARPRVVG